MNAQSPWWNNGYENYVRSLSPRSEYILMAGVGHFLHLEKPAEFNSMLTSIMHRFDLIRK
jgi:pimeloyl-ACP methyl ester carboxylesterase